jgi:predicted nuclease of predicted toxin-antitoxin system
MKVLIDEMRDGLDRELRASGYEAYSVRKLAEKEGLKLKSDYSILKYAEKNEMVLVTEDIDNIEGCMENDIPCVMFGQKDDFNSLLEKLEILKYGIS